MSVFDNLRWTDFYKLRSGASVEVCSFFNQKGLLCLKRVKKFNLFLKISEKVIFVKYGGVTVIFILFIKAFKTEADRLL